MLRQRTIYFPISLKVSEPANERTNERVAPKFSVFSAPGALQIGKWILHDALQSAPLYGTSEKYFQLFRCVLASLSEGVSVRQSVCRSIRPSVGRSIPRSHNSWISEKWAEFEQNSIRNEIVCHLKDNSKTSTRAVCENASVVRTLFDLLLVNLVGENIFV